jgi:hypothetical protein
MSEPDQVLADKIASEPEWNPSTAGLRDAILARFTERLDDLAAKHPNRMTKAIAVIVQAGTGRTVLVLSDPASGDLVKELERYRDLPSPLTELLNARLPI